MRDDVTLRKWFNKFTEHTGETVEWVMFGWENGWGDYKKEDWPTLPSLLTPIGELGDDILDHEFYEGFGSNDSPNLCAWSESWVLFSDNYDGAESICWVPRNPSMHEPIRPGGG